MATTLVQINVHVIFHTKNTGPIIRTEDLQNVFSFIGGIIKTLGETPVIIGGMSDHIHILTSLPKTMSTSDFLRTIKANSSRWIRESDKYYSDFSWQKGCGVFSVSPSKIPSMIKYIQNQESHHKKRSFKEEYLEILEAYGIEFNKEHVFED